MIAVFGIVDLARVVAVLVALESGGKWDQPGGGLQFTARAWKEETRLPFPLTRCPQAALGVAQDRLERFQRTCARLGVEATPELLIGSWRHGLFGAMDRVKRGRESGYMKRGMALYRDASFDQGPTK